MVITPKASGIARAGVIAICAELGIKVDERALSLSEAHAADEIFTASAVGEVASVGSLDGRDIGAAGPVTTRIQAAFRTRAATNGWAVPGL